MDFWQRARTFAEEAAKKSQELTQGLGSANLSDVVSEASKRSKELAAEASKMSKEFASEALKRADQISAQIPPAAVVLTNLVDSAQKAGNEPADLEKFGITDELREFVKGITPNTFRDFPLEGTLLCSNNLLMLFCFLIEFVSLLIMSFSVSKIVAIEKCKKYTRSWNTEKLGLRVNDQTSLESTESAQESWLEVSLVPGINTMNIKLVLAQLRSMIL